MAGVMDHQGLVKFVLEQRSILIRRGEPTRDNPSGNDLNEADRLRADEAAAAALSNLRIMFKSDPVIAARIALKVCEEEELQKSSSLGKPRTGGESDIALVEILIAGWILTDDEALEHQLIKYITKREHTNPDCFEAKAMRAALEPVTTLDLPKLRRSIKNVRSEGNSVVKVMAQACIRLMSVEQVTELFA